MSPMSRVPLTRWLSLLLIAAALLIPGTAARGTDDPRTRSTLELLQTTIVPRRDLVDLAQRLMGVTTIPAPPTSARELEVGEIVTFSADNVSEDYNFSFDAELVYKTPHVYMFVEVGQQVDRAALGASAERFETLIRPLIHEIFGEEWIPGIDGDPHLYIVNATRLGSWVGAYYDSTSQYPQVVAPKSNQHEMFLVNLDTMRRWIGTPQYEAVLAHEFQHMVHWYVDLNEDTWLNEGLSELARLVTGYGPPESARTFLANPAIQLNHWPEESDQRGAHYGAAFMFAAYFYDRYGEAATTTLVQDPANGMASVANALTAIDARDPATGAPVTVEDLFGDWLVANLLLNPAVGDGRYAYHDPDLQSLSAAVLTDELQPGAGPQTREGLQWGPDYLYLRGGVQAQELQITFTGAQTVGIVPVDAYDGRYMWWSNRADESNSRLTRAFDLTGVQRATLHFRLWYFIENLWDYGYVMVSTDGGATWTPLETARTTRENPHGNGYGPGYTGSSGEWVEEVIDLTPYAGQPILLRFEYITDAAVTQPGMLIDAVSIPEIGYSDDFESGEGGWTAEGWIRTDNVLPQQFLVQLVQTRNPDGPVTRLLSSADAPEGTWTIRLGGDYGNAAIVVSGLAPVTTEPARYTIEVRAP